VRLATSEGVNNLAVRKSQLLFNFKFFPSIFGGRGYRGGVNPPRHVILSGLRKLGESEKGVRVIIGFYPPLEKKEKSVD
jgi:hypothetical protein